MVIGDERYVERAEEALMAIGRLSEEVNVRKQHLKAAQMTRGGENVINFSAFKRDLFDSHYALDVSTSSDPKFKAQIARNTNYVWGKVNAMIFIPEEDRSHFLTKYREGDMEYMVLFQDRFAYMATWFTKNVKEISYPLLITQMKFLPNLAQMDMPVRGSAKDDVAQAHRINLVENIMQIARERPKYMSIKNALARFWLGYAGINALMWDNNSRSWSSQYHFWDGTAAAVDYRWNNELEGMREKLRTGEMDDTRIYNLQLNGHDRFFARPGTMSYGRTEILPRIKQLAVHALDLAKIYSPFLDAPVDAGDAVEAVAGASESSYEGHEILPRGIQLAVRLDMLTKDYAAVAAVGDLANEVVDIGHDADALEGGGGAEICYAGDCGGITDVVGGNFSVRIGGRFAELIRKVDAAIAANGANAAEGRDDIKKLHEEFRVIADAFQSHVVGSLQLVVAERMLRDMPDLQLEEGHKKLADVSSTLALLRGCADDLAPEEPHVAARNLKYWVLNRDIEMNGRDVPVTMLRMKEQDKKSSYVVIGIYRPGLWPPTPI